jgi:hypothetical protein
MALSGLADPVVSWSPPLSLGVFDAVASATRQHHAMLLSPARRVNAIPAPAAAALHHALVMELY